MISARIRKLLSPFVELRDEESAPALLLFGYSFLAMTAYYNVKPAASGMFVARLGAENVPYAMLVAGFLMGGVTYYYGRLLARIPPQWGLPAAHAAQAAVLVAFSFLLESERWWIATLFYFWGRLLLGALLVNQFWSLAGHVFNQRQARRLFGFIGAGAALGGIAGATLTSVLAERVGTPTLLLVSALLLAGCVALVRHIVVTGRPTFREESEGSSNRPPVSAKRGLQLLRDSDHLKIVAGIVGIASLAALVVEQQLNMAAEAHFGGPEELTSFFAKIAAIGSAVGFLIQIGLTSRILRVFGIGFGILALPSSIFVTALLILVNPVLWTVSLARVVDISERYSFDKVSREILFQPLSAATRLEAKPFVDVAVDRFIGKGVGSLLLLLAIKGLGFQWFHLSLLSLHLAVAWVWLATRAHKTYASAFRSSLARRELKPGDMTPAASELDTLETLVTELGSRDEERVTYAIDLLRSLGKEHLVPPLLLRHDSTLVKLRVLDGFRTRAPETAAEWPSVIEDLLHDDNADVRAAALTTLASIRQERTVDVMRGYLEHQDARIAVGAAVALARSTHEEDVSAAEKTLERLTTDAHDASASNRTAVARALGGLDEPRFYPFLERLLNDPNWRVAEEALAAAEKLGPRSARVGTIVAKLGNRRLKRKAREVLASYGESAFEELETELKGRDGNPWIRRHIPMTLALIPSEKSVGLLLDSLGDEDGFLRFKAIAALEKLHREHPKLSIDTGELEDLAFREALQYYRYFVFKHDLFGRGNLPEESLLHTALEEKLHRLEDRVFRLMGLVYSVDDLAWARRALRHGDEKARAAASEVLDNLLRGKHRRQLLPLVDDIPTEEKVRRASLISKIKPANAEDTLATLIADEDAVVAACALELSAELKKKTILDRIPASTYEFHGIVAEAARWAATQLDAPHSAASPLREPLPAVVVVRRLRELPLFRFASIVELFRVIDIGRQELYEPGHRLLRKGERAKDIHVVVEGSAYCGAAGNGHEDERDGVLGWREALDGSVLLEDCRAKTNLLSLTMGAEEFLDLLSNNIELTRGIFQMLLASSRERLPILLKGVVASVAQRVSEKLPGLRPVDKVLLLQRLPIFEQASGEELVDLGARAREISFTAGSFLFEELGGPGLYMVVSGELSVESQGGAAFVAVAGDAIGVYEPLLELPRVRGAGRRGTEPRSIWTAKSFWRSSRIGTSF